ncbi:MAG: hypothetical protein ND866_27750 [Pyrinomonadaceae bacterium]|nr:hypothetical protein [Pyrinomonadaceae bacterium]
MSIARSRRGSVADCIFNFNFRPATQLIFQPLYSFHVTPDSGGTTREDQRAVGVEDFNPAVRLVLVRVVPNLDGLGDPLRPGPGDGRIVREGLE